MLQRLKKNFGIASGGGKQLFRNATGKSDLISGGTTLLGDGSFMVVFDSTGEVLMRTGEVKKEELLEIPALLEDRETAMKRGLTFTIAGNTRRYEVHRYQPEHRMVYGRNMNVSPEKSTGWALMWADKGGKRVYALLFYDMPQISAKMVAAMDEFMHVYVARDRKRTK